MLCFALALNAHAAIASPVGITFWKENSNKEAMENDTVDTEREATLTRLANGTYTLVLPIRQFCKLGVTGHLTGLTIGDIAYDGVISGDFADGTAVLTIKNLPASILTGGDCNDALLVTCNMQMDADLLGAISTCARMSIWTE